MAGCALLLLCAVATIGLLQQRAESDAWIRHTVGVQGRLSQARILSLRSEMALRNYVLTGAATDLNNFRSWRSEASSTLAELAVMTADNPQQVRNITQLQRVQGAHSAEIATVLSLVARGDRSAAARWFNSATSRNLAASLRTAIVRISDDEARLLAERDERSQLLEGRARTVLLSALAWGLTAGGGA